MRSLSVILASLFCLIVFPVSAQVEYNYDSLNGKEAGVVVAGLGIALIIFITVIVLIALAFLIFWIIMLVDCIKRDFPQKTTWIIILLASWAIGFSWLAAIIYYFEVKRKNLGQSTAYTKTTLKQT